MLDNPIAAQERHERFLARVVAAEQVWGLKSDEGWVASQSNDFDEKDVMPFWSDRAYAKQCAKDDWSHYEPTPIPLELFIREWLPGMSKEGCLVGTNWNVHLIGREVEPMELLEELLSLLDSRA